MNNVFEEIMILKSQILNDEIKILRSQRKSET